MAEQCTLCRGNTMIDIGREWTMHGLVSQRQICPHCYGTGLEPSGQSPSYPPLQAPSLLDVIQEADTEIAPLLAEVRRKYCEASIRSFERGQL